METISPEEIELNRKRQLLERLKDRLADREEATADLRAKLERFEAQYTMSVAGLYAELDEIEADIAEEELKLVPDDEEIKKRVEELRRRAEESAARAAEAINADGESWQPTAEAKKAYHDLARNIHPDLAIDSQEKERRHVLMAELNLAYTSGDQQKLNKLVHDYRNSPEQVQGDTIGDELVRTIRQISQVKHRFAELKQERLDAEASEQFELHEKVDAERAEGRDMLAQMANRTRTYIVKAQRRLTNLRSVNEAAEGYVKEKYGMDIEDFRKN
ncbi:MAG: hypothetical protein ABJA02_04210 [Acidobacteriota bacterium]